MGGPGSGRWYRWDTRTTLDQVQRLDVRWLHRQGYLDSWSRLVTWYRREQPNGSVSTALVDDCLVIEYRCRRRGVDSWKTSGKSFPWTGRPVTMAASDPGFGVDHAVSGV